VPHRAKAGGVSRLVNGASFALDAPTHIPPVWGSGQEVLWAQGEPLMICAPQGVGKTTLAQNLTLARIGSASDLDVLGYAVTPDRDRRVLCIAADRPSQIARSMRRMVSERDRRALAERLIVWRGPLPFDLTSEPDQLLAMVESAGAGTLVIDSLKDVAMPLSEDRVGAAVNIAIQKVIAAGVEVCTLHHQRKAQADNKRPAMLSDVYGSTWLTSGHGSVVLLWGQPGDPVVELVHLKQPGEQVGPLELVHDHIAGTIGVRERPTIAQILSDAAEDVTVADAAMLLWGPGPSRNDIEKTRRKLDGAVKSGLAERVNGAGPREAVRYSVIDRVGERDKSTALHGASRTPVNADHAAYTPDHAPTASTPPPFKGARDAEREATELALIDGAAA
jgi:replicative DNA helicase